MQQTLDVKLLNKFITDLYKTTNTQDMDICNAISHFLTNVKLTKRLATYNFYNHIMEKWLEYFNSINIDVISKINNEVIFNYIKIKSKTVKNVTINKAVTAIKTMIKYLEDNNLISNMNIKVKKLKEDTPEIKIIELDTLKLILKYLKDKSIKTQLIFKLLISTGIRRTETIHIKRSNINFRDNSIYLERTKTGHPRYIFFDEELAILIRAIIKENNGMWLFTTQQGNQITTSTIDHIFLKIKKDLTLSELSPHKLRHTYATMLLENGTDIETVRLLMGHCSYEMTKRYLHVKNKKLKDSSCKNNPLATISTMTDS